jgi:hypothetical protein
MLDQVFGFLLLLFQILTAGIQVGALTRKTQAA